MASPTVGIALANWQILLKGSLTQKLVRSLKNVDLHIIATEKTPSSKN
jgi:two-component system sensor histidine kinase KdpD